MRKFAGRAVLTLTMVTSLALVTPVIADAKTPPQPTMQQYRAELRLYNHEKSVINQTFHAAIASAKATEVAALALAQPPAQKFLARTDFNEARATDISTWQSALKNLGPPPKPPVIKQHPTVTTTTTTSPATGRSGFQLR